MNLVRALKPAYPVRMHLFALTDSGPCDLQCGRAVGKLRFFWCQHVLCVPCATNVVTRCPLCGAMAPFDCDDMDERMLISTDEWPTLFDRLSMYAIVTSMIVALVLAVMLVTTLD